MPAPEASPLVGTGSEGTDPSASGMKPVIIGVAAFVAMGVIGVVAVLFSSKSNHSAPTPAPRTTAPTPAPVPPSPSGLLEFSVSECTVSGGCQSQKVALTIDQNYRWYHDPKTSKKCECTDDPGQCSQCVLDKPDKASYLEKYDVAVSTDELSLTLGFKTNGARLYLLDQSHLSYQLFQLLGKEFTFTVDSSKLPCGMNGALYAVEMKKEASSGFGPAFGTGYCDAQCPTFPITIDGQANTNATPQCCNEFDFWEANRAAMVMTTHPCQKADGSDVEGVHVCVGDECKAGDDSVCDKNGCGLNPYANGHPHFYSNISEDVTGVDSTKPVTVTTQFIAEGSELSEIKRFYTQDGKKIDLPSGLTMTDAYCESKSATFNGKGELAIMGRSLQRGMVIALSLWNDAAGGMVWMDGSPSWSKPGHRMGPCGQEDESKTDEIMQVVYSNIKFGEIGSTT